ncbi:MAG: DUF763 domain-containing protein [Candidatus Bathyarchaeia archaeon]
MDRAGYAELPLHGGKAPQWLVTRMIRLAKQIIAIILEEHGHEVFLQRISDPYWFQALGCVLGYDWHSSGVTTVLTGVLKSAIDPKEFRIAVCGGKGKASKRVQLEINSAGNEFGFSMEETNRFKYASRMSAKIDNVAIQAGYPLYHHAFILCHDGKWAVVQQGMCVADRTARRYHWLSQSLKSFIEKPHTAIVGDVKRDVALDMTANESEGCRKVSVDLSKERPEKVVRLLQSIRPSYQRTLQEWMPSIVDEKKNLVAEYLSMPVTINWKALKKAYEFQPRNYEELLGIRGLGASTIRGLSLISELIYGQKPSWKDPVKYSFAYGGKDGVPFPIDKKAMDNSIIFLREAIENSKLGDKEKIKSLQRLRRFLPANQNIF